MRWIGPVLLASCVSSRIPPPSAERTLAPVESAEPLSEREAVARRFEDIVLTDQTGRRVRLYEDLVRDQVVVINFMYATCTGSCPGTSANLAKVQRLLDDSGVRFVSISLDPEQDDPNVLAEYARVYGAQPGWHFLTGEKGAIESLRRSLGFYDPDPEVDADRSQHAGICLYGNEPLGRWCHMPSLASPDSIASAVRRVMR